MLYLSNHISTQSIVHLQSIRKSLVHLGNLRRDTEVDGTITDLNNKTTNQIRVNLHPN